MRHEHFDEAALVNSEYLSGRRSLRVDKAKAQTIGFFLRPQVSLVLPLSGRMCKVPVAVIGPGSDVPSINEGFDPGQEPGCVLCVCAN